MSASKSEKIGEMLSLRKKGEDESRSDRIGKTLGLIPEDEEAGGASPVRVLVLSLAVISGLAAIWLGFVASDAHVIESVPNEYIAGFVTIICALVLFFSKSKSG